MHAFLRKSNFICVFFWGYVTVVRLVTSSSCQIWSVTEHWNSICYFHENDQKSQTQAVAKQTVCLRLTIIGAKLILFVQFKLAPKLLISKDQQSMEMLPFFVKIFIILLKLWEKCYVVPHRRFFFKVCDFAHLKRPATFLKQSVLLSPLENKQKKIDYRKYFASW